MVPYVRPAVAEQVFRDADGRVIPYGTRWGDDGPPDEAYSVDSHPERFAPLHLVADALIDFLATTYDVTVDDDAPAGHAVRAVRVRPNAPDAATLTFVFTDYPAVRLHAGLRHDFPYPDCGCDACDLTWEPPADDLERHTFAVADGRYREFVADGWSYFEFRDADGDVVESGGGRSGERPGALPDGWAAWPRRTA